MRVGTLEQGCLYMCVDVRGHVWEQVDFKRIRVGFSIRVIVILRV